MKKLLPVTLAMLALAACNQIPKDAYYTHGAPETLLDSSSEVVNVNLRSGASVNELAQWINRDQPSRAELHCNSADALCGKARKVLAQFAVPASLVPGTQNSVSLIYERVVARDCENRFIDNHINPYELTHPTYGCSVASNLVQMVSDKRQFTAPALMDDPSAEKAVQTMSDYGMPNSFSPEKVDTKFESLLDSVGQASGGGSGGSR